MEGWGKRKTLKRLQSSQLQGQEDLGQAANIGDVLEVVVPYLPVEDLVRSLLVSKLWFKKITGFKSKNKNPQKLVCPTPTPTPSVTNDGPAPKLLQLTSTRSASSRITTPQIVDYEEFKKTTMEKASAYSHPSELFKRGVIMEMRRPCREFSQFPLPNSINANVEFPLSVHKIVGSARGLLCMLAPDGNCIIWNPANHSVHKKPLPFTRRLDYYGFGYDCANDDYKIVLGVARSRLTPITHIFSLKRNSWYTTQQYLEVWHTGDCFMKGVYLDGALHWRWGVGEDNRMSIVKFDLSTDSYSMMKSVTVVPELKHDDCLRIIGVAENCLCYYTHTRSGDVHSMEEAEEQDCDMLCDGEDDIVKCDEETITIWKMTEHGDQIFETIELQSLLSGIDLDSIHVLQDGHALLQTVDKRTILYNLKDKNYVAIDFGVSELAVYTKPEGTGVSDMVF